MANFNPERCPLKTGEEGIDNIPSVCLNQCEKLWAKAIQNQRGICDYYNNAPDDECDHEKYSVGHSHETLNKPDNTERRSYSIVDQCDGCYAELIETIYTFDCPYNDQPDNEN